MELKLKKNYQPFIGFEFDGVHSKELGIKRVSSSDRYNILLNGEEQTYTNKNANQGINFLKADKTTKRYSLNIAFDKLTEANFNRLKKLFDVERYGYLVLDEEPYKKIKVKCDGSNQIKWLCFMENGQRIYKGEGTLGFVNYTGTWEWVSPYINDYYNLQGLPVYGNIAPGYRNGTLSFEKSKELFSKTNLFLYEEGKSNMRFNKKTKWAVVNDYCIYITPYKIGRSFPILYIQLPMSNSLSKVTQMRFYGSINESQSERTTGIEADFGNITDEFLRIDLHNKTIYGVIPLEDKQSFIFSGKDYSNCLDYSRMGEITEKLLFRKENSSFEKAEVFMLSESSTSTYPHIIHPIEIKPTINFLFYDNKNTVNTDWSIVKVEYENLF